MKAKTEDLNRKLLVGSSEKSLSTEEAFLWSRVGSGISLKDLLALSPWPEEQVFQILDSLLKKGALTWEEKSQETLTSSSKKTKTVKTKYKVEELPAEVREQLQMDQFEALTRDLDLNFRTEVLMRLHEAPNQNPYEILGLKRTATSNEIKIQYLELSRKFHPDRFFRRDMGIYKRKLEKLFTHIQQAYQALKNPYDREALDRKLKLKESSPANMELSGKKLDPMFEKIGKAELYYQQGIEAQRKGDISGAFNFFNLASQLNPSKEIYQRAKNEIQPLLHQNKAKALIEKAQHFLDIGLFNDALQFADEAVKLDTESGEAAYIAAKSIVELGLQERLEDALHLLRRARTKLSHDPEPCVLLGRLYLTRREKEKARLEFEAALKRQPQHSHAKKLLSKLDP